MESKGPGPVVQSVVSLTSSLRVISLTDLADSIYNILIFFAEKMWIAFALQKLFTFFNKKFQHICVSLDVNFNESLTNDIVSFEQLGSGLYFVHALDDLTLHILHMLEGTFLLDADHICQLLYTCMYVCYRWIHPIICWRSQWIV